MRVKGRELICPDMLKHGPHPGCPGRKVNRVKPRPRLRNRFGRLQRMTRSGSWICAEKVGLQSCAGEMIDGSCSVHRPILDLELVRTMTIGQRIRYLRLYRNIPQPVVAGQLGVSASYLQKVENGTRTGDRLPFLCRVSDVLRISLEDLIADYREVMKL